MTKWVVDANVVLDWLGGDTSLYKKIKAGAVSVFAPSFLLVETTNILLCKKKLPEKDVEDFLEVLLDSGINFIDFPFVKIKQLLNLAAHYRLTTYDALYLLLAQEMGIKLISTDKELTALDDLVVDNNGSIVFE